MGRRQVFVAGGVVAALALGGLGAALRSSSEPSDTFAICEGVDPSVWMAPSDGSWRVALDSVSDTVLVLGDVALVERAGDLGADGDDGDPPREVVAHSVRDGSVLWTRPGALYGTVPDQLVLMRAEGSTGDELPLDAIEARTGSVRWATSVAAEDVPVGGPLSEHPVHPALGGVVAVAGSVHEVDDGSVLWSTELVPLLIEDDLAIAAGARGPRPSRPAEPWPGSRQLLRLDPGTGEVLWDLWYPVQRVERRADLLVVGGLHDDVTILRAADGAQLASFIWTEPARVVIDGDRAFAARLDGSVQAVSLVDGAVLWTAALPSSSQQIAVEHGVVQVVEHGAPNLDDRRRASAVPHPRPSEVFALDPATGEQLPRGSFEPIEVRDLPERAARPAVRKERHECLDNLDFGLVRGPPGAREAPFVRSRP